jgi:hypothetical protein
MLHETGKIVGASGSECACVRKITSGRDPSAPGCRPGRGSTYCRPQINPRRESEMKAIMSSQKGETHHQDMKLYGLQTHQGEDACERAP